MLSCNFTPNGQEMDQDIDRTSKKRSIEETQGAANKEILLVTDNATQGPASPETHPEGKKQKPAEESDTQQLLETLPYAPLAVDIDERPQTRGSQNPPAEVQDWVSTVVGVTPVFWSEKTQMYRCASSGCSFKSPSKMGVTSHYGKYCKFNPSRQVVKEEPPIQVTESDEEII